MKILKHLFILIIILTTLISCEKENTLLIDPELILSTDTLIFNEQETKSLFISTKPGSTGEYQIISYPDWVEIYPESGYFNNDIQEIIITSNISPDIPKFYFGELVVMSTFGTDSAVLKGYVGEHSNYYIPDSIDISVFYDSTELTIVNQGNTNLNFSATVSNDFIQLSEISGAILIGKQKTIEVSIDKNSLETGSFKSEIYFIINDILDTVKVTTENFNEKKISLTSDVVDAEYIKSKNLMVFVSSTPSQFNVYNPETDVLKSLPLTYIATCLSVSPDGETVAIGHDGHITLVDLDPLSLVKNASVSCQAFDIVLSSENWAYVFPEEDQWEKIRCVNLDIDSETESTGNLIYENTRASLHPSGKYIYTADDDLEKFDITTGTANYLYDSPYHGDYPIYNNLWYSEDGIRIFTEGGSVFKTSEIENNDLLYNGTIAIGGNYYNKIVGLDHSSLSGNLFIIMTGDGYDKPNMPFVSIYNATNLVYKKEIELEKFVVPDGFGGGDFYNSEPYFVFSNSSLKEIYILVKASGSGLLNEWAIEKIEYE